MLKIKRAIVPFMRFNSKVEKNLSYTKDHEWVKLDGKIGTVGISDFAQDALGDITHVGYDKKVGDVVKAHEKIGDVESVKTVSVIYSPVSGKITAVNKELDEK
jgi:glycine cleavage system H protein